MNDLLLLSTLLEGPKHGYALKKQIAFITGQVEMHNNLVYPLLKRFVRNGWVSHRKAAGERGQTRELYTLTAKGREEIVDASTRNRIVDEREKWLRGRAALLANLSSGIPLGQWGGEVVKFLQSQAVAEQKWIARLRKKMRQGDQ